MNNQFRNRDKRMALLLIAAFAWLFIGSLIIFHQEHVLGKHIRMNSQLFISPKSKDKNDYAYSIEKSLLKIHLHGISDAFISDDGFSDIYRISCEFKSKESSSETPDDAFLTQSSLRAPPEA